MTGRSFDEERERFRERGTIHWPDPVQPTRRRRFGSRLLSVLAAVGHALYISVHAITLPAGVGLMDIGFRNPTLWWLVPLGAMALIVYHFLPWQIGDQ